MLSDCFSLRCLGPRMNHLPPFKFMLLNNSCCINIIWWRGIFYWFIFFAFILVYIHYPSVTYYFSSLWFYYGITFYTKYFLLSYSIDVVYSFLSKMPVIYFDTFFIGPGKYGPMKRIRSNIYFKPESIFHENDTYDNISMWKVMFNCQWCNYRQFMDCNVEPFMCLWECNNERNKQKKIWRL